MLCSPWLGNNRTVTERARSSWGTEALQALSATFCWKPIADGTTAPHTQRCVFPPQQLLRAHLCNVLPPPLPGILHRYQWSFCASSISLSKGWIFNSGSPLYYLIAHLSNTYMSWPLSGLQNCRFNRARILLLFYEGKGPRAPWQCRGNRKCTAQLMEHSFIVCFSNLSHTFHQGIPFRSSFSCQLWKIHMCLPTTCTTQRLFKDRSLDKLLNQTSQSPTLQLS